MGRRLARIAMPRARIGDHLLVGSAQRAKKPTGQMSAAGHRGTKNSRRTESDAANQSLSGSAASVQSLPRSRPADQSMRAMICIHRAQSFSPSAAARNGLDKGPALGSSLSKNSSRPITTSESCCVNRQATRWRLCGPVCRSLLPAMADKPKHSGQFNKGWSFSRCCLMTGSAADSAPANAAVKSFSAGSIAARYSRPFPSPTTD